MKTLFEITTSVLTSEGMHFSVNDEQTAIYLGIGTKNGNWKVNINFDETTRRFAVTSACPINTPDARQTAMCELLNRMNNSVFMGRFSMDVEDGQVVYQTSAAFPESYISEDTVSCMLHTNISTFDIYLPAIIAIIYQFNEPALAFLEVQSVAA